MTQEPSMDRRQFVRGAGAAGIAGAAALTSGAFSPAIHSDDKSGSVAEWVPIGRVTRLRKVV